MGLVWEFTWDTASMRPDSKDELGETLVDAQRITINSPLIKQPDRVERTVLHEILHAVLFASGQEVHFDEKQEESIVRALENGMYPVLCELVELGYFRKPKEASNG